MAKSQSKTRVPKRILLSEKICSSNRFVTLFAVLSKTCRSWLKLDTESWWCQAASSTSHSSEHNKSEQATCTTSLTVSVEIGQESEKSLVWVDSVGLIGSRNIYSKSSSNQSFLVWMGQLFGGCEKVKKKLFCCSVKSKNQRKFSTNKLVMFLLACFWLITMEVFQLFWKWHSFVII